MGTPDRTPAQPTPGSREELEEFARLRGRLVPLFERVFPDRMAPRTVVVIPALSLDDEVLSDIRGVQFYEERMLCMLMLLRLPRTRVVYVTSVPVDPTIISYYLHLMPGIPGIHARKRLTMLSCHDSSTLSTVTEKILARPRLLRRIRDAIPDPESAHMTCFNATELELTLAVRLGIPMFACDPAVAHLGSKSGSRQVFREAGILFPEGDEDLRSLEDIVEALTRLRTNDPALECAAVKLEEGTSGQGNAVFSYEGCPRTGLRAWIREELPRRLQFESEYQHWDRYLSMFESMGGVVETWIDAAEKRSPSMQGRINPLGELETISTHDQVLGGATRQVFLACDFPADPEYRLEIQELGLKVGEVLRRRSALGRYGVDFVSRKVGDRWEHYAIEINLRKGGTTHTFRILQFLTDGSYDPETGLFLVPSGGARFYHATDNLKNPNYRRLTPEDLMDVAVENDLHYNETLNEGVFFHLIGALSEFGKLGMVCVGTSRDSARALYQRTVDILNREALRELP